MSKLNIVVPVDFSKLSGTAVRYAIMLSRQIDVQVELVHIVKRYPPNEPAYGEATLSDIHIARDDMDKFSKNLLQDESLQATTSVIAGEPLYSTLNDHVKEKNSDLIVMGSKGANALKRFFMGSNAAAVVKHSSCPVIVVPENALLLGIKDIVYASDMLDLDAEMNDIIPFARLFNAWVHVLHVYPSSLDAAVYDKPHFAGELTSRNNYENITYTAIEHNNIVKGIEEFLLAGRADLLALFAHPKGFLDQLFGGSVTQEETFRAWLPVLTFNKKE